MVNGGHAPELMSFPIGHWSLRTGSCGLQSHPLRHFSPNQHKDRIMRHTHTLALGALVGAIVLGLGLAGPARSQLPAPKPQPLPKELVRATQLAEADVLKLLVSLGPAISLQIASGGQVEVPGLGIFRIGPLAESRNLEDGRPVTQPARNVVQFIPSPALDQAANAPGAVPTLEVPAFQYVPFPGQTPGQKVPPGRTPSTRVR